MNFPKMYSGSQRKAFHGINFKPFQALNNHPPHASSSSALDFEAYAVSCEWVCWNGIDDYVITM